jgi:hypothetical protein
MKFIASSITLLFCCMIHGTGDIDRMLLFKKIDTGQVDFITTEFTSYSLYEQQVFLNAKNASYQTPLHHALYTQNILAAFALVNIIQDHNFFLYSDSEENTPFSLAQRLHETNIARIMYAKFPHSIQQNFDL